MNSERRLVVSDQPFSDEAALYTNKKNKIKICDFGEAKYFEVEDASMDLDDWEEAYISLTDEELAQIRDEALKKTAIIDMNENTEKHYPSDDLSETSDPREPNDDVEDTGRRVVSPAGEDEVAAPFPPALVEDLERRRLEDLQATGADQAVQGYMWDHSMFKQLAVEVRAGFMYLYSVVCFFYLLIFFLSYLVLFGRVVRLILCRVFCSICVKALLTSKLTVILPIFPVDESVPSYLHLGDNGKCSMIPNWLVSWLIVRDLLWLFCLFVCFCCVVLCFICGCYGKSFYSLSFCVADSRGREGIFEGHPPFDGQNTVPRRPQNASLFCGCI